MEGLPLADRIRALDEAGALRLVQALALAERSVLSLPVEAVDFPQRTKAKDGGVDGRTSFPADAPTPFPTGVRLWQVKSGSSVPRASREFAATKSGDEKWVVRELRSGGIGYVLFWTNDPVDPDAEEVRRTFSDEIGRIAPGESVNFLFLSQIVDLVRRHPGVALAALGLDGEGILAPTEWANVFDGAFQSDPGRDAIIATLRANGESPPPGPYLVRVYGDGGVGKSRTVFEAINIDGLRERTVIATKGSSTSVAEMVAHDPEAAAVLVIDPATDSDIATVQPFVAAAQGRLVVVAVQDHDPSVYTAVGHLVVSPLDRAAIRRLLDPGNAGTKADEALVGMAGGYPGLALQIREVTSRHGPGAELVAVARDPDVRTRLARLVPKDEARVALASLAPFGRVGVDGDARGDLAAIATALGLDHLAVAAQLDRFNGRLLTKSGDYRRVSPDIVAVWLSEEALATFGGRLLEVARVVPDHLALSLVDRLANMPGSPAATRFAGELVQIDRFKPTTMGELGHVRARMLLALAVLDPAEGLKVLADVLEPAGVPGSMLLDVLAALEELLWSHEAFEGALELLFRFAATDPATLTYGPVTLFEQSYQLVLSGTQETYTDRVIIARRLIEGSDIAGKTLIARVLGGAFDLSATRGVVLRGRASTREDWYPATDDERTRSLAAAWDLLIELAQDAAIQPAAARSVAHAIRAGLRVGLAQKIEAELPSVDWTGTARAELLYEIRLARDHDKGLTDEQRELLERLMRGLEGDAFEARLATAMGAEPYQLEPYTETSAETFLDRLADDMVGDPTTLQAAVNAAGDGNPQTVRLLFYKFGSRVADDAYKRLLYPPAAPALIGFIAARDARGSDEWATTQAREWLADADSIEQVPALVRALAPSDERALIAVEAVAAGADSYELSLFAFGSWVRPLEAATIVRIVEALNGNAGIVLEHALGIVSYWLDEPGHDASADLVAVALRLVDASLKDEGESTGAMTQHYRSHILSQIPDNAAELLPRVIGIFQASTHPGKDELNLVCRAASLDVGTTVDAMVGLVARAVAQTGEHMWAWRLSRVRLLSALADCTDTEVVAAALPNAGLNHPATLFRHVAVTQETGSLDPMFAKLLELGGEDQTVWSAGAWAFEHPKDAVWGPESSHLRARAQAASDLAASSDEPLIQRWASWTNGLLTERAKEAELREADDDD